LLTDCIVSHLHANAAAEEESRLLIAVTAPKVVAVGGDTAGEGFATISFKTGPNLQSYDYTVSCYEQNLALPTTSCAAIGDNAVPAAGDSVSGETGKAFNKITANVTGLGTWLVFALACSIVFLDCVWAFVVLLSGGILQCVFTNGSDEPPLQMET
jgi:hypothetical protein